jgi:hypothetical protein
MTTKAKLLLFGGLIVSIEFLAMAKIVIIDRFISGIYTPSSEWISLGLSGAVTIFIWMFFLKARREIEKPSD